MSGQGATHSNDDEFDTPEKRKKEAKKVLLDAVIALRGLQQSSDIMFRESELYRSLQEQINVLVQRYFEITGKNQEEGAASAAGPAKPADMPFGGRHHRIRKSSVQRRKHHSNKKGKTVRRKMTRTRR